MYLVWRDKYTRRSNFAFSFLPLYVSYKSGSEKFLKYQLLVSSVIMSVIPMTSLFYKALILQGEIDAGHS